MRKIVIVGIVLILTALCLLPAAATETTEPSVPVREPGQCGETMTWKYEDGVLTISGNGRMDDFPESAPWAEYKNEIHTVVLTGGVSYIGQNAFRNYDKLTFVDFGSALREIGPNAFRSCEGLTEIYLPRTFKIFGEECFLGCGNLTAIHTEGSVASFRNNSMWDVYATIYFPAERPWGLGYIEDMEKVFKGRIEFRASDGTDPYNPTEPTEEATEPSSEPTEPSSEPTEPSTAPTEVTETVTAPTETMESTAAAPSEEPDEEETEPETSAAAPEGDGESDGMGLAGMVAAAAVVALLLFVAVAIGKINRKGKYSR